MMYQVIELFGHERDEPTVFEDIERAKKHMAGRAAEAITGNKSVNLVLESHDHRVIQSVAVNVFPGR